MRINLSLGYDSGGLYVEAYTDDDGGSGYGDNPKVGRWYGSLRECEDIFKNGRGDMIAMFPMFDGQ